ncbi:MAG: Major facilitator superfamily MFS_1 [candidate division TA06 bacterium 34_109]|uniref:Major facilitator superfamily MFS_1 n=1 Tax=candidate division TA06 bacterium 34_109 TaxID=1635277 RepID=A0A117M5S5_UNCT6|nr:MAG: Major facilitator superfamily MFS_1 [candidate division TA06 bacterium 34_109]
MVLLAKEEQQKKDYSFLLRTLLIISLSYIATGLSQNGFLCLLPFIREEFDLTRVRIGYYSTSFFISATLLAIFSGNIVDKLGPKKNILVGIGCTGIVLLFYGISPSYQILLILAIFAGLGWSIMTPAVIKGTVIVSPSEKEAFFLGIVQASYNVGSLAGASLLPLLAINLGWRMSVQTIAAFALLTALLAYIFYPVQKVNNKDNNINVRDTVAILESENHVEEAKTLSFKDSLLTILKNKSLFRICILGILFGVSEGSVVSHFAVFLSEDLSLNPVIAGFCFGTLYVGGIIGLIGWGWISDHFFKKKRQIGLFIISLVIGVMFLLFSFYFNTPSINPFLIIVSSLLLGLGSIGWSGAYFAVVGELAGERHAGIATGLALVFIRTGMLLAPIGFGYLADLKGNYQYSWLFFSLLIIAFSYLFLSRKRI